MALLSLGNKFCKRGFLPRYFLPNLASFVTEPELVYEGKKYPYLKTSECHPGKHTLADVGKYYEIPKETAEQFLSAGIWATEFRNQCSIFNETCLMIRKPALEIIQHLKNSDYSRPINKYLLYGDRGAGKTIILSYLLHYALLEEWLIVNVPWVPRWLMPYNDIKPSEKMEGHYNIDFLAATWLNHFKILNLNVMNKNQLRIKNDYEWNNRESSSAGDTMLSIIEYGVTRGSFSSDVLLSVLNEIKLACKNNEVKCLVFIDGFNALFHPYTKLKNIEKKFVTSDQVTSLVAFKEMALADWHNGAAILTCDLLAGHKYDDFYLPLHLLSLKGFEYIHPFIPIEVENYNDFEFQSVLDYYRERRWLRTSKGDEDLKYLTGKNGFQIMEICKSL